MKALAEIFEESRPAFDGLIDRLKEPLREGRWESVLGDDVSGRLPALVIGDLMARVARERGRDAPSRFFIPGRRQERSLLSQEEEYLRSIKERLGQRTLLVTEYIASGGTMKALASLLNREGIPFDIAAVSSEKTAEEMKREERFQDAQFYIGTTEKPLLGFVFWARGAVTGIEKRAHEQEPLATRNFWADPELVVAARKKAQEMADELYEKYFAEKSDETAKAAKIV